MRGLRLAAVWAVLLIFVIAIPSAMAAEEWDKQICWKKTQNRGVGKTPVCDQKHVMDAGLCYNPCKTGFKGVGPVCWQACPQGYHDDGATCRKDAHIVKRDSYGRGVGKPLPCKSGMERDAGLCYQKCRGGYKGVGPVCWKTCPAGYKTDGATCRKNAHIFGKKKYGRGIGTVPKSCPTGQVFNAGLCYPTCKAGYKGVGPVCWQECKTPATSGGITMSSECGAACCTNRTACNKWAADWAKQGANVLVVALKAIAKSDPTALAGVGEAVEKFPAKIPKCQ